jgi:hypothetical protein
MHLSARAKPERADSHYNLGNALAEKGELEASIDHYNECLAIRPSDVFAYLNKGNAQRNKGDMDGAIVTYKQAIKIKPNYAEAYHNMGVTLSSMGDFDAAIDNYCKAFSLKPDDDTIVGSLLRMPVGHIPKDVLNHIKHFLDHFAFSSPIVGDAQFLEAGYHLHSGDAVLAFQKFRLANKVKALALECNFEKQKEMFKNYTQDIKSWEPNVSVFKKTALKKIFILGPSRSGKTTLEQALGKNPKIKLFYEAHKVIPKSDAHLDLNRPIDFEEVFFEKESKLISQGYEAITCTDPSLLYSVIYLADKLPNSYFVFVSRNKKDVAPEIFTTNYREGHVHSYDPNIIMSYLNFYRIASYNIKTKIPNRVMHCSFDEIVESPSNVVNSISDLTSIDFKSGNRESGKLSQFESVFQKGFQKLIQT